MMQNLTFNQWVFLKCEPKMLVKKMPGALWLVKFEIVARGRNPTWQFMLVNRKKGLCKMNFDDEDDIINTLFEADEIWYAGGEKYPNPLFGKKDELLVEYDLACSMS